MALLLSHPISLRQLILGKVGAASLFGLTGVILVVCVSKAVDPVVPRQEFGFSTYSGVDFTFATELICIPVAVLPACLQQRVSFTAKNFKEAQACITFVMFVPMALS